MASDLYAVLKGRVYSEACIHSGHTNESAKIAGFKDVYDVIMSDSDHDRQPNFLMNMMQVLTDGHRQVLLDGLAREYAGVDGWMAYVARECA